MFLLCGILPTFVSLAQNPDSLSAKAEVYFNQGEYAKSLAIHNSLLEMYQSEGDSTNISHEYFQIGRLSYYQGSDTNISKALEYFKKALDISSAVSDTATILRSHRGIGATLLYNPEREDSALFHLSIAEKLALKIEDYHSASGIQSVIGTVFLNNQDIDQAEAYVNKAYENALKSSEDEGIAYATERIGILAYHQKDYQKSEQWLLKSLNLYQQLGVKDMILNVLEHLRSTYDVSRKWTQYKAITERLEKIREEIYSEQNAKSLLEVREKFETAQKEEQIALQKLEISEKTADLRTKQFQIAGLSGGLLILILFGLVFYNQYKARQNQKLQAAILAEKERGFESVIQATEEERKRISKDLHDGIGQQLSALKLALNNITGKVSDDIQEDLEIIADQFSKSADEVRHISHQMMPRKLMENGLREAIVDLLKSSFQFSEIKYEFEHHRIDARFDEKIEINLYRVLQELINNIIKHAEAKHVSVQLIRNKDRLVLFVEDNGKGMNTDPSDGHGLLNIRSRLDMVKGSVNYEPGLVSGTSTTVSIPIT